MSQATSSGLLPSFLSQLPSLAAMVVLPAPCNPQSMNTVTGEDEYCSLALLPPIRAVSSSLTTLTICCWALRLSMTSRPTQRSVVFLTKSLTTL